MNKSPYEEALDVIEYLLSLMVLTSTQHAIRYKRAKKFLDEAKERKAK